MNKHNYPLASVRKFVCSMLVSSICVTWPLIVNGESTTIAEEFRTTVYTSGQDGYNTYRIPTIVQGTNGYLYAFAEGRKNSYSDDGNIDIVMRYSGDNGRTWSSMTVIKDAGSSTAGNPAPVVDATTGRLNLLYCINNSAVYSMYADASGDGNLNWSSAASVSTSVLGTTGWVATGPVHGIQLTRGANAGRLIVTGVYRSSNDSTGTYGACVYFSDDGGSTWLIGATDTHSSTDPVHPSENMAVELTNGKILVNARDQWGSSEANRAITLSSDGGESYDSPFIEYSAIDTPIVQNSMLRFAAIDAGDAADVLVYSAPHSTNNIREDLTLYLSCDEGKTWGDATLLYDGRSAYSDLVKVDDSRIGVLYEAGYVGKDSAYIIYSSVCVNPIPEPPAIVLLGMGSSLSLAALRGKKIIGMFRRPSRVIGGGCARRFCRVSRRVSRRCPIE